VFSSPFSHRFRREQIAAPDAANLVNSSGQ
jgi:hypothetical protein